MTFWIFLEALKGIVPLAGVIAAIWGVYVYFSNSRLRRAEWLASLYEKFYEQSDLKDVRDTLDCSNGESPAVTELVNAESREFTDYLNFFEFVAVLGKSDQLKPDEIEDLFGYYLDCLQACPSVRAYIDKKGYEQLQRMLRERAQGK